MQMRHHNGVILVYSHTHVDLPAWGPTLTYNQYNIPVVKQRLSQYSATAVTANGAFGWPFLTMGIYGWGRYTRLSAYLYMDLFPQVTVILDRQGIFYPH